MTHFNFYGPTILTRWSNEINLDAIALPFARGHLGVFVVAVVVVVVVVVSFFLSDDERRKGRLPGMSSAKVRIIPH